VGAGEELRVHLVFFFREDGDFSHNPDDIPAFWKSAETAESRPRLALLVTASVVINWPWHQTMLRRVPACMSSFVTWAAHSPTTGGFKCFRRTCPAIARPPCVRSNGYSLQIESAPTKIWRQGMTCGSSHHFHRTAFKAPPRCPAQNVREAIFMVWRPLDPQTASALARGPVRVPPRRKKTAATGKKNKRIRATFPPFQLRRPPIAALRAV